ncbi:MAG: hypothetical protein V1817_03305, partial [Candidatus Micrarchaeota archaeon]
LECNNSIVSIEDIVSEITIDCEFAVALGLFLAEGDKKTKKKIAFSNTSLPIIKYFKGFLTDELGVKKSELRAYVYLPPNKRKIDYANELGIAEDRIRFYENKKSKSPCVILSAYGWFYKKILDASITLIETNLTEELAKALVSGVVCGDGSISFSPKRKYYEICVALGRKEADMTERALEKIGVDYKERIVKNSGLVLILIHKKKNFQKLLEANAFKFFDEKTLLLAQAINHYTYSR